MKITLILLSIVAIGALLFVGCAHRLSTPEERADYFTQKISNKLDLNDEQVTRLMVVKDELLAARQEIHSKRQENRETVRELLNSAKFDQERALALVDDRIKEITAHAPEIIAAVGGFWDNLTSEQQAKVRAKMEKHFEHHSHWGYGSRY